MRPVPMTEAELDQLARDNAWNSGDDGAADGVALSAEDWAAIRATIDPATDPERQKRRAEQT